MGLFVLMICFSIDDLLIVEGGLEIGRREASSTFFLAFLFGLDFSALRQRGKFQFKKKGALWSHSQLCHRFN